MAGGGREAGAAPHHVPLGLTLAAVPCPLQLQLLLLRLLLCKDEGGHEGTLRVPVGQERRGTTPPCTPGALVLPTPPTSPPAPPPEPPAPPITFADGAAQLLGVHLAAAVEGLAQDGVTDHCALLGTAGTWLIKRGGPHRRVLPPSSHPPSPYLAAADGALLVVVGCPAGAVRPVLPLEEAGVGVLLQLLRVPGLGALGELGLPRGQAGPPCLAPVGDVHLGGRRVGTEGEPTGTPRQAAGTVPILSPSQPTPGSVTQPRTLPSPRGVTGTHGGDLPSPASPLEGGLWC